MISPRLYLAIAIALPLIIACSPVVRNFGGFVQGCSAQGYAPDRYLAYCDTDYYGDYEHGALYLETEPAAVAALQKAKILFLGDSRMQFAFSTPSTRRALERPGRAPYYLMGFGFGEEYRFSLATIDKLHLAPKFLVVNIDQLFFVDTESPPAKAVLSDAGALADYRAKAVKQAFHATLCRILTSICGSSGSIFRSRENGFWYTANYHKPDSQPVVDSGQVNETMLAQLVPGGEDFLARIAVPRSCIVFVNTPQSVWPDASARELARRLGITYVAARDRDWATLDGSHLVPESAARWSAQILDQITPTIDRCVSG
ncbi:MAG TPA: hypothetical protein VGF92_16480 [Stellaceae bacterium]|jgi:hypothetical protein